MADLKKCFVISPIGDDTTPERKEMKEHANLVLEHFIRPALKDVVSVVTRADEISKPGDITRQVLDALATYDLVVADLSYHNANVFYELAIRHMLGKPYVQMMKKGEKIPFDVGQQRTIFFDPRSIPDLESTRRLIKDFAEASLVDTKIDTPLGSAVSIESLKADDPVQQSLSLILDGIETLKRVLGTPIPVPQGLHPFDTIEEFERTAAEMIEDLWSNHYKTAIPPAFLRGLLGDSRRIYKRADTPKNYDGLREIIRQLVNDRVVQPPRSK